MPDTATSSTPNVSSRENLPPLGTVGRIVNPNKGQDWGKEYKVVGYNPTVPPTLQCETTERLRRWTDPTPKDPGGWKTIYDLPAATAPTTPVDWFQAGAEAQPSASEPHAHMAAAATHAEGKREHEAATHARASEAIKPKSS